MARTKAFDRRSAGGRPGRGRGRGRQATSSTPEPTQPAAETIQPKPESTQSTAETMQPKPEPTQSTQTPAIGPHHFIFHVTLLFFLFVFNCIHANNYILFVMNKELARIGDRLDQVERNMDQLHAEIAKLKKQILVGQQVVFAKKEMALVDLLTHDARKRVQQVQRNLEAALEEVIPMEFNTNSKKRKRKSLIMYDHNNQENSE